MDGGEDTSGCRWTNTSKGGYTEGWTGGWINKVWTDSYSKWPAGQLKKKGYVYFCLCQSKWCAPWTLQIKLYFDLFLFSQQEIHKLTAWTKLHDTLHAWSFSIDWSTWALMLQLCVNGNKTWPQVCFNNTADQEKPKSAKSYRHGI